MQGQGVIAFHQPPADIFEISYKNHKTGKIRRWNLMDAPFQELPNGVYNQSGDVDSEVVFSLFHPSCFSFVFPLFSSSASRSSSNSPLVSLVKLMPLCQVYNVYERERRQSNVDCQKKSLLHLAESLWALELERTSYLILLLIVLFSTQVSKNSESYFLCQKCFVFFLIFIFPGLPD